MTSNIYGENTDQPAVQIRTDVNGPAWHKMGSFIGEATFKGIAEKLGNRIAFFQKIPTYLPVFNGSDIVGYEPDGDYDIVHMNPLAGLRKKVGNATAAYYLVQPTDIGNAFDENVNRPIETLGFIGTNAQKMFLTWELPNSNVVVGKNSDDVVKMFGTILAGFDGKVSISLSLLTFRVLCANTFQNALEVIKGKKSTSTDEEGRVWVGRHNSPYILRDLSHWMRFVESQAEKEVELTHNFFNRLAATPVDSNNVLESLLIQMYPYPKGVPDFYPPELRGKKEEGIEKLVAKADEDRQAVEKLFSTDGTAIDATAWGLFNAVTEYENYYRPSKKDTYNSIVFGNRSKQMQDAAKVLFNFMAE